MEKDYNIYQSPLVGRYGGKEMPYLFSSQFKYSTWRRLWVILAECEKELGLDITQVQIDEMKAHVDDIDFAAAEAYDHKLRHEIMAHIHAFGDLCPLARPIIHLGATSCYVSDNTEIIVMARALDVIKARLINVVRVLHAFAQKYAQTPTLAFTHFQAAQPTTVGKRATLWINDLMSDLEELEFVQDTLRPLGCKGATGTQASFLELFGGDGVKAAKLDQMTVERMGFARPVPVSGQTYSRKTDSRVLNLLSQIAQSASKFSNDVRLLCHMKEIDEPFESNQVGSSAMAYKRNPMRSERIGSLSRYIIVTSQNAAFTAATQWLERTLDDSANKRIAVAESFLAADAVLGLYQNVTSGLVPYPGVMEKHLREELPFMATENIMMDAVSAGGDRQTLHERIRIHSIAAASRVKLDGSDSDLLQRIADDPAFGLSFEQLMERMNPDAYTGRAAEQTEVFLKEYVQPVLDKYVEVKELTAQVNV